MYKTHSYSVDKPCHQCHSGRLHECRMEREDPGGTESPLLKLLFDGRPVEREQAARELAGFPTPVVLKLLKSAAEHDGLKVVREAAQVSIDIIAMDFEWQPYVSPEEMQLGVNLLFEVETSRKEPKYHVGRFSQTGDMVLGVIGNTFHFDCKIIRWRKFPKGFLDD